MEFDVSVARQCFRIDGPNLIWMERPLYHFETEKRGLFWNKKYPNKIAGVLHKKSGYVYVSISNKRYLAHRVAWAIHYGRLPNDMIDHIDGNRSNNSIENLREVSRIENCSNSRRRSDSNSGLSGVRSRKDRPNWYASITCGRKIIRLGVYDNYFDACCARMSAQNKLGFSPRHGR